MVRLLVWWFNRAGRRWYVWLAALLLLLYTYFFLTNTYDSWACEPKDLSIAGVCHEGTRLLESLVLTTFAAPIVACLLTPVFYVVDVVRRLQRGIRLRILRGDHPAALVAFSRLTDRQDGADRVRRIEAMLWFTLLVGAGIIVLLVDALSEATLSGTRFFIDLSPRGLRITLLVLGLGGAGYLGVQLLRQARHVRAIAREIEEPFLLDLGRTKASAVPTPATSSPVFRPWTARREELPSEKD